MRRILVLAVVVLGLAACQPAPTVTATPSTLAPACKQDTTVTGKVSPAGSLHTVVLEYLDGGKTWKAWNWFDSSAPGTTQKVIKKSVPSSGSYSLTYAPPSVAQHAIRLRVRGYNGSGVGNGVGSKSWVSTRQGGSC